MATLRGSDGSATLGGTAIGEFQGWELDISRAEIDKTKQGDTSSSYTLDIPDIRGTMSLNLDYGDAQQASLLDMLVAGSIPTPLAAVFIADDGKTFSGNILPTSARIGSAVKAGLATVSIPFVVDGGLTIAWA